jgi:hypothetical protein
MKDEMVKRSSECRFGSMAFEVQGEAESLCCQQCPHGHLAFAEASLFRPTIAGASSPGAFPAAPKRHYGSVRSNSGPIDAHPDVGTHGWPAPSGFGRMLVG